ncbi:MAG: ROK family protein [Actinomycetota bacterium]|nr:ROK family protein [Actinomycetota bacterium]
MEAIALGVDIGGTKLLVAAVGSDGTILARERLTSPRGVPDDLVASIMEAATKVGPGLPVGVGVAGIVSRDGVVRYGPNLNIRDVDLQGRLMRDLEVPVVVRNDATVALYGELRVGAARGARDAVMLTLGTGVGGGIVAEGRLVEGTNGMAGEFGHLTVDDGGRRCGCGGRGHLEAYASGSAIGLRAQEMLNETDEASSLRAIDLVDGEAVARAAVDGDELALRVLREGGYWLGVGLMSICNALDPETFIIGGGASASAARFLVPEAVEILGKRILGAGHRPVPPVVTAELGDDAGAIGSALLVHGKIGGPEEDGAT